MRTIVRRWSASYRFLLPVLIGAGVLVACQSVRTPGASVGLPDETMNVTVATEPHHASACSGTFVAHDLDHVTSGPGDTASTFDGTGAGVAAGDLDGDGDLDLVLPNLSGASTILENTGSLTWQRHDLQVGRFRGAAVVDTDADGHRDIVLTTGIGPPVLFRNTADAGQPLATRFSRELFDGVRAATYSMAWGDLGGDGDLDLVTGSYNAELTILRNSPVLGSDTGVVLHEGQPDGSFGVTRLSPDAQALAIIIADINGDGAGDVLVGNDLATPDAVWFDNDGGWLRDLPFSTTSYSTMSYDAADIDNDGQLEIFSTDMAQMVGSDPSNYVEVDADMAAAPRVDEIQTPENVLNKRAVDGTWDSTGEPMGVRATGWSWSGLFGDLDQDGLQDMYVVNGMRSDRLFDFLPEARLVEENQAFRNDGTSMSFAPDWGLGDQAGGRGAVMADVDRDGDLDIVVNNLDEPARLFENQLCSGTSLTIELRWSGTRNLDALDANIEVRRRNESLRRAVTSSRGYLSSAPSEAHFGLGIDDGSEPTVDVVIDWPDGEVSVLEDMPAGHHIRVER